MIAATLPLMAVTLPLTVMVKSITGLYGISGNINEWVDKHIQAMQASENSTISKTGKVLDGAKSGFGIGYIAPVAIIAVGQFLLGNTMAAVTTVGSALTLSNPIAMTCAAVGAIYYGWSALSEEERSRALDILSQGLNIGIEFIKSVVRYVIESASSVIGSKNLSDLKSFISDASKNFGSSLYDVTRDISDKLSQFWSSATESISEKLDKSKVSIRQSGESMLQGISQLKDTANTAIDSATRKLKEESEKSRTPTDTALLTETISKDEK